MKFRTTIFFAFGLLILIIGKSNTIKAQEISPYLIGNNAWYDGSGLNPLWDDMAVAKFQTIRIGGATAEGYAPNNSKYLTLINGIRSANAEPIVQVPRYYTDQQVKDFITNINITNGKKIKFWSIGNEPDHQNRPSTLEEVSAYIKRISSALKSVDPTIKVFGPETASFNSSTYLTRLLGGNLDISGKDANGNYYLDVYTWHKYMFTDISGLEGEVNTILSKLNTLNANRPLDQKMKWGFTEFNSSYDNDVNSNPDQNVWSFHAGQLFAEVYGLGMRKGAFAMNAWSMFEGPDRSGTDLSLFDKDLKGRSSYYHSLILGQNFRKNYITTTDNKGNVVVIPMQDSTGVAVMILNKDQTTNFDYSLRLDNGTFVQAKTLQIKVNAGINTEITGSITKDATQMLVFDAAGALVKRYTYTSLDANGRGEPLVETITTDPVPMVTLTQPVSETKIKLKSSVMLTAQATDNGTIQKVEFTANGALIGTSKTPPYLYTWTPTVAGTYTVSARAFDNLGGVGFATGSSVIVEKVYNYISIPATIEAEAFDEMSGIQLETTTDAGGGQNIGYCDAGDWMDYTINVPTDGQYTVEMRVASLNKTGAFSLKNGTTTLATFALPNGTGGWQTWTTLSKTVTLKAGNQTLRLAITGKDININWLKISSITSSNLPQYLNKLEIFPNPVSRDHFSVKINGLNDNESVNIEIYNLTGQTVFAKKAVFAKGGATEIGVHDEKYLDSGVYIISVQSKTATISRKLILKD
jgi:hypothetical protein